MEPIVREFTVACSPGHAFATWTERLGTWWPRSHTATADPRTTLRMECREGGAIIEHGPDGDEHRWGEVVAWEPPARLVYRWHLMFDAADATEVELTFAPLGDGTLVRLEHRGWERLGAVGPERRQRNEAGWSGVVPHFQDACLA